MYAYHYTCFHKGSVFTYFFDKIYITSHKLSLFIVDAILLRIFKFMAQWIKMTIWIRPLYRILTFTPNWICGIFIFYIKNNLSHNAFKINLLRFQSYNLNSILILKVLSRGYTESMLLASSWHAIILLDAGIPLIYLVQMASPFRVCREAEVSGDEKEMGKIRSGHQPRLLLKPMLIFDFIHSIQTLLHFNEWDLFPQSLWRRPKRLNSSDISSRHPTSSLAYLRHPHFILFNGRLYLISFFKRTQKVALHFNRAFRRCQKRDLIFWLWGVLVDALPYFKQIGLFYFASLD